MTLVLAISDEIEEGLSVSRLRELAPDLVLSCGDLPFEYLEYVVSVTNVPLLYVPGNHDPDCAPRRAPWREPWRAPWRGVPSYDEREEEAAIGPEGCVAIDGRVVEEAGLLVAGLGGSLRYREGPNQYTQWEMRRRAAALSVRARLRHPARRLDVLLTHAPPLDCGDEKDGVHEGFVALHGLVRRLSPRVLVHGHVHPYGVARPDRVIGETLVVNVIPHRLLEIDAEGVREANREDAR